MFQEGKVWKAGQRLLIPDRAHPGTTERRTSRKKLGYHRKGILSVYSFQKDQSGFSICDLVSDFDGCSERFQVLANHYKSIYPTSEIDIEDEFQKLKGYMERVRPTVRYMEFISYVGLSRKHHQRKSW